MISFDLQKDLARSNIRPRAWQTRLIQLLRRRLNLRSKKESDILVHAGPGAGKTLGALLGFKAMQREKLLTKFVVFCHRSTIASQWQKSAEMLGLTVKFLEAYPNQEDGQNRFDGLILTYQSASTKLQETKAIQSFFSSNNLLAIADEAHHLGVNPDEPEGAVWGKTFLKLTEGCCIRLGLTGTPFRSDNLAFCSAKKVWIHSKGKPVELINPDLCVEPRELISTGEVRPLEFHFQDGWIEHIKEDHSSREISPLSTEQRELWRSRNLRRAIHLSDSSSIAVQLLIKASKKLDQVRSEHKIAAGLVIATDIEHAKGIANLLKENGDSVQLVHSQNKESSERLAEFKEGKAKWLVSVDMCSEGFDAPRLRVIAYLTTVVTKSRFLQAITRAVRMNNERAAIEAIPRKPSYVFAPADPMLMEYASSWSEAKPYLIKSDKSVSKIESSSWISRRLNLPMEAIGDKAGEVIRMGTIQLPQFLK